MAKRTEKKKKRKKKDSIPRMPPGLTTVVQRYWDKIDATITRELVQLGETPETSALAGVDWRLNRLGTGKWGVVYPTACPRWVVKVTLDPTEGPIIQAIMNDPVLRTHPGICYYAGLWKLPETIRRHEGHELKNYTPFVVLREDINPKAVLEGEVPSHQVGLQTLLDGDDDEGIEGLRDIADRLNVARIDQDKERSVEAAHEMADYLLELGEYEETEELSDFMQAFYQRLGGALADVHSANIGARQHNLQGLNLPKMVQQTHVPAISWVLLDPGRSDVQGVHRIPALRNPESPEVPV